MPSLMVSRTVVLDSSGAGTVTLGPERGHESWHVTRLTTTGASTLDPTLKVSRFNRVIDQTPHANADVSETDLTLSPGDALTAAYTGGTAGASMVFYMEGEVSRGGVHPA